MGSTHHFNSSAGLAELSSQEPEIWQQVMTSIRTSVEQKRFEQLAEMSTKAQAAIARWLAAADSPLAETQHAKQDFIRARMTVLAVEQFIAAFTGANVEPSFTDRLRLKLGILRTLEHGKIFTTTEFDHQWNQLTQKASAAFAVQKAGFWSIPTKEVCEGLLTYAGSRSILEIGCGRGLYVRALSALGGTIYGIDDGSWDMANNPIKTAKTHVAIKSASAGLKEFQPSVVLSVWPPPGNAFEREIFASKSVQLYLAIVSKHRFASGNWSDYKAQDSLPRGFSCVTNESINKLLRPLEANQQIFIFRRK